MADSAPILLRLRLDISYDGTDFAGWALQPGLRTVAGVIGDALAMLFRAPVPMVVAGRTDAGVHATGQVAHIDVDTDRLYALAPRHLPTGAATEDGGVFDTVGTHAAGIMRLSRRLARLLPPDVRVRDVTVAPTGFDARFGAMRRHYRYRIGTAAWGVEPLSRHGVLARPRPLDTAVMRAAAEPLIGLHDFAAYCKPRPGATTIRDVQRLTIGAVGDEVVIDVSADAFCHSMVRSIVGVLIAVGEHRIDEHGPGQMLTARARTAQVHTAPAGGLTLLGVDYPPDDELRARVRQTRALRTGADHDPLPSARPSSG